MSYANPEDRVSADGFMRLLGIMRRLRDPNDGCPWDLEQNYRSITPYTIEEAYEVADAVEREAYDELPDELGDLLLQVVFLSQIASEDRQFDIRDVVDAICTKMERRHPHIFGDVAADDAATVKANWEAIKADEMRAKAKVPASLLDDVPKGMPSLVRALKLQKRAAKVGFDWPDAAGAVEKLREEIDEVTEVDPSDTDRLEDELGDVFFSAVNLARKYGLDADAALRRANLKFERRFRRMESDFAASGTTMESAMLADLEAAWQAAKLRNDHVDGA